MRAWLALFLILAHGRARADAECEALLHRHSSEPAHGLKIYFSPQPPWPDGPELRMTRGPDAFALYQIVICPMSMLAFRVLNEDLRDFLYELAGVNVKASQTYLGERESFWLPRFSSVEGRPLFVRVRADAKRESSVVYISARPLEDRDFEAETLVAFQNSIAPLTNDRDPPRGAPKLRLVR